MLSRLQGKQNLWWLTDGHCTKCVSSSRSWHSVHLRVGFGAGAGPVVPDVGTMPSGGNGPLPIFTDRPDCWDCCASVDVTVVLETCRDPDDRRPLDDPANFHKKNIPKFSSGVIKFKFLSNIRSLLGLPNCQNTFYRKIMFWQLPKLWQPFVNVIWQFRHIRIS